MKRCSVPLLAVAICVGWVQGVACAQDPLDGLLKDVSAYQFGQSRESLTQVSEIVRDSYGNADARASIQKKLLGVLQSEATLDGKQFVCRQLSLIGTDDAVPVLAGMLTAKDTSDMARYALERIPGDAPDKALLDALGKAEGLVKVGVINSLGVRRCAAAVPALAPIVLDADLEVAGAAIAALGKIGGGEAVDALAKAQGGPAELHAAWADASLLCADGLAAAGEKDKALAIYDSLAGEGEPDRIRVAAFNGRVRAQGDAGLSLVSEALLGSNGALKAAAAMFVRTMPGKAATDSFAGALARMTEPGDVVLLLSALADRGDGAALDAVKKLLRNGDAGVCLAAIGAVGKLGDASCVETLAGMAAGDDKDRREAARNSLAVLKGTDVDGAMAKLMEKGNAPIRAEMARALAARNAVASMPALLAAAKDSDEAVRVEAFKALAQIASANELPAVVDLLVGVEGDNARREAKRAVVTVSKAIPEENQRAAAVLAVLPKTDKVEARRALIEALGEIGDNSALPALREAVKDAKPESCDAAVRALADWPNSAVIDDLFSIAGAAQDDTQRVLALRGLLRLLEMPSDRAVEQTVGCYEKAMGLAKTPDDKKKVLGGLATVKDLAALALVKPCLADEALKEEAATAARRIKASVLKASASHNEKDAQNAVDGNKDTQWSTGCGQQPGQWFQIDQGAEFEVTKAILDTTPKGDDFPRGYQVFVTNDPANLGDPVAEGEGSGAVTEIAVKAKSGRYVRVVQTGTHDGNWWSLSEVKIESK